MGEYDVIILGAGIAGSMLGAILARNGARVLLADAGVHPRFAVGESTTPHTLNIFRVLAQRYRVPEIEALINYERCLAEVGPTAGTKKHFGFMLHHEGREPDPLEANQYGTSIPHLQTSHLFRQDSDAFLFHTAIRYGCTARQGFQVTEVELADDHVAVRGAAGERITGRYLVDGSGYRSPVARALALREEPCPLKHHARSLFTHMIDVRPSDECLKDPGGEHVPWAEGTMHHLIERGWFWIIPFNNDPRSINPLVSVGLTFDERRYPKPPDVDPETEFRQYVARYPLLERIFADAKTVRPWVSTGRLQYTSTRTVGHRWCLMSHAAGFIDPLYSRGLTNTGEVINALAWRLLAALADDDFAEARFAYVEDLQQGLIRHNDEIVNASYISWSHYDLWNAVFRVWAAAQLPISMRFGRVVEQFQETGDDSLFLEMENDPYPGLLFPANAAYRKLFDATVAACEAVDHGSLAPADAARTVMDLVQTSGAVLPHLGFQDPDARLLNPGLRDFMNAVIWLGTEGPEEMRYLADNPRFRHLIPEEARR